MAKVVTLEAINLAIGYGKGSSAIKIAEGIDFALSEGDFALMLGCNGAGKSTLLRTLAAVQQPLSGEVKVCSQDISQITPRELAQRVSVVFTDKTMAGGLLVEEVVALGRYPYTGFFGKISKEDKKIVNSSLLLVGMENKSKKYLSQLSDGERQKIMIAKALAQQTSLIILDEPTAFLDLPSRIEILYLLKRLASEEGKTILLSTHDVEQSLTMADKLLLLKGGEFKFKSVAEAIDSGDVANMFAERGIEFDKNSGRFFPKQSDKE
ncbi:MAG: ABC transporter ATP-binding protein [Bacteroidales bacterium]|nr:ABC transporter ATP-binding protein [Bacteroidales bacterium]